VRGYQRVLSLKVILAKGAEVLMEVLHLKEIMKQNEEKWTVSSLRLVREEDLRSLLLPRTGNISYCRSSSNSTTKTRSIKAKPTRTRVFNIKSRLSSNSSSSTTIWGCSSTCQQTKQVEFNISSSSIKMCNMWKFSSIRMCKTSSLKTSTLAIFQPWRSNPENLCLFLSQSTNRNQSSLRPPPKALHLSCIKLSTNTRLLSSCRSRSKRR